MADIDKQQVIQQIVNLQKEYAKVTQHLDFHCGPAKRKNPLDSTWKTIEAIRDRQNLIDKRLRYIEKFLLS